MPFRNCLAQHEYLEPSYPKGMLGALSARSPSVQQVSVHECADALRRSTIRGNKDEADNHEPEHH